MLEVGRLQLGVALIVLQVEVAIGHAEAALEHRVDIDVGILVVLPDIAAEEMRDAVAVGFGEQRGEARLVDGADLREPRLDRGKPLRLDRRRIEIGGIGASDHAVRIALRRLENLLRALLRQVGERGEHAIVGLVRRDRGVLGPGAIGIGIEIVAGQYALVHPGRVEAEVADFGLVGLGRGGSLFLGRNRNRRRHAEQHRAQRGGRHQARRMRHTCHDYPQVDGQDMILRAMDGADPAMETAIKADGGRSTGRRVARR